MCCLNELKALARARHRLLPLVTDGGDQAFLCGRVANRVEVIGQSLHNQMVLTWIGRTSIDMFLLTLAYRATFSVKIRSSLKDCVSCLHCMYICLLSS